MSSPRRPVHRRLAEAMGLTYQPGAEPGPSAPRRSRYTRGPAVNPRLDEDIDMLLHRVAELERRLEERGSPSKEPAEKD